MHQNESPSPEDLLDSAIQAIGGEHAIQTLESFKLHGMIRLPDGRPVIEIDLATAIGGKVLAVQTFIGIGQTRFGSDGKTSWEQNPSADGTQIFTLIENKVLSQKVRQLNWVEWITTLPLQLDQMEVIGETEFDQEACWVLQINAESVPKTTEKIFFSKSTNRIRGRQTIERTNEGDVMINIYFRDWNKVDDLYLFHAVVFDRNGVEVSMVFDTVKVNSVDERIFTLPDPVIALRDES